VTSPAYAIELRQRFSPLQNRYDILGVDSAGQQTTLAYAEQKRFSLKEKVTFWAGADRAQVVFTIGARNVFEIAGVYDVAAGDGSPLAVISKDVVSSFTRSTYKVEVSGRPIVGKERSAVQALMRRAMQIFTDVPWFLPIHFDFTDATGTKVLTIERQMKLRDVYQVAVYDGSLDWRVPAALAVTVDAFMNR
jgi:uncharacterized protein YxjI